MKPSIKHFNLLAATLVMLLATIISPALADKPTHVTWNPIVFSDLDPCTGNVHTMTMIVDYYEHSGHKKNYVAHLIRTGYSDSGYELFAGHELIVANGHAFVNWWRDMWRNDDGRIMEVSLRFIRNENQDTVSVDKFVFRCIGG